MASLVPGEVVFLDFPFSRPPASKRRPALVLLDAGQGDVVIARITSSRRREWLDVPLRAWEAAGLLAPSFVRLTKLVTVADSLILRKFGQITPDDAVALGEVLRHMFDRDWPPAPPAATPLDSPE